MDVEVQRAAMAPPTEPHSPPADAAITTVDVRFDHNY